MSAAPAAVLNRLLQALPASDRQRLLAHCETVHLAFGAILCERAEPYVYVYFPLTGFVSLVASVSAHPALEVGMIGNEGMLGGSLVLGVDAAPVRAVVQGAGTALRLGAGQLQQELAASPTLLRHLQRYLYVQFAQLAQTATCTHFHEIEPRLARWLLMTHDRCHADHFRLTHEFLADMLGVRRSGITVAAGELQRKALISYSRGEISILNRRGLEAVSCECYRVLARHYAQLLGDPGAPPASAVAMANPRPAPSAPTPSPSPNPTTPEATPS